jgi:hypothetical protein
LLVSENNPLVFFHSAPKYYSFWFTFVFSRWSFHLAFVHYSLQQNLEIRNWLKILVDCRNLSQSSGWTVRRAGAMVRNHM